MTDPPGDEEFLERGNPNVEGSSPSGPTTPKRCFSKQFGLFLAVQSVPPFFMNRMGSGFVLEEMLFTFLGFMKVICYAFVD